MDDALVKFKEAVGPWVRGYIHAGLSYHAIRNGTDLKLLHGRLFLRPWPDEGQKDFVRFGKPMQFVTLEDETGLVEAVAFPDAFQRRGSAYSVGEIVAVSGTADLQDGVVILQLA